MCRPKKRTIYRVRAFEPNGDPAFEADYASAKAADAAARRIAKLGSAVVLKVEGYPEFDAWSPVKVLADHQMEDAV